MKVAQRVYVVIRVGGPVRLSDHSPTGLAAGAEVPASQRHLGLSL
ncbi:hypothetical protein [Mycobacterium kubicae]|nr:hypothetical protein [Mycobacterium kubicae]